MFFLREYLSSFARPPTAALMEHTAGDIQDDEILAACGRLGGYGAPGPNGISLDLYLRHPEARAALCVLANHLLARPEFITKELSPSHTLVLDHVGSGTSSGSSRTVELLDVELRIIADILAERALGAIGAFISCEQSAVISGRHIRDTIHMVTMAQARLSYAKQKGVFLFFDQAMVGGLSRKTILQVLECYCLPSSFINAILALYRLVSSGNMANGIAFNPFDAREDVFQECRLSGVIVVVLMELLQCLLLDSKNKKLEGAFLELPSGRMSHVCHGDSLVITLSDDRFLADIKETIDLFCTSTGVYFDFFKTRALYIGRDFSTEPLRACPEFPLVPIADSEPFYYLGAFFGNADVKHYTRDVNVMLLDLLDSAYVISCRHSDHCIRTQALDHFVSPRLQHILEFVPIILHLTVDITDDLAKLVCGHSSRLPDDEYEAALQARTGIYGFVDFKHTRMAVQLGLVHLASSYFQQIRFPDDNGLAVPVWAKLLLQIWQLSIKSDGKNQMPQWPCDIQAGLFVNFFYDPFLQFEPYRHSRFLDNTLPPAWDRLYKALFSNEAQQLHQVHIAEHSMAAPRLQLPFIGTNLWRSTKLDWPLLYGAFKDVPPLCTPITVANLPQFIAQLGMLELKLKGSAHYCQIRKSMYRRFSAHFEDQNKHGAVARVNNKEQIVLKNAGFDVSAISETGIPAKELPQYIERLTTLIAEWKDKNPNRDARDNLVTHFMEIYMGAQEHDAQLTPSARNAPASLHLTYGHLDYAAYSVPFVHWSNLADTRAMLQRLDAEHKLRKDAEAPSPAKIIKPRQRRQRHKPADDASIPKPRKRKERD